MLQPASVAPGIQWPAVPDAATAQLMAMVLQLDGSQWLAPDALLAKQQLQLTHLMRHAVSTTAHYAVSIASNLLPHAGAPISMEVFRSLPILDRHDVIAHGNDMVSSRYPAEHGVVAETRTSGTTGKPIALKKTGLMGLFWRAMTLRDHIWHQRDLSSHLGAIRYAPGSAAPPQGIESNRGWGPATRPFAPKARVSLLSVHSSTDEQLAWLIERKPATLILFPTVLDQLIQCIADRGIDTSWLRDVRTVSETLSIGLRERCKNVLGASLVDNYSAEEVGYIALQCPDTENYHVMAERVFVEVLDENDAPCVPGQSGRVVLTDLHNFASPLIRYAIGDYAEVGAPCPCGRGLPVLTKILGRKRNMLVYPDGQTRWPVFTVACREAAQFREIQLVQRTVDTLVLRIVPAGELSQNDKTALTTALHRALGHKFDVEFEIVSSLGRPDSGKLEECISLLA